MPPRRFNTSEHRFTHLSARCGNHSFSFDGRNSFAPKTPKPALPIEITPQPFSAKPAGGTQSAFFRGALCKPPHTSLLHKRTCAPVAQSLEFSAPLPAVPVPCKRAFSLSPLRPAKKGRSCAPKLIRRIHSVNVRPVFSAATFAKRAKSALRIISSGKPISSSIASEFSNRPTAA